MEALNTPKPKAMDTSLLCDDVMDDVISSSLDNCLAQIGALNTPEPEAVDSPVNNQ